MTPKAMTTRNGIWGVTQIRSMPRDFKSAAIASRRFRSSSEVSIAYSSSRAAPNEGSRTHTNFFGRSSTGIE